LSTNFGIETIFNFFQREGIEKDGRLLSEKGTMHSIFLAEIPTDPQAFVHQGTLKFCLCTQDATSFICKSIVKAISDFQRS